ncbi:MAG: hypothetical protein FJX75_00665 [Armatimonadetes bacterium]|nr:hypothetical protein [Armatimonadota bacterium]
MRIFPRAAALAVLWALCVPKPSPASSQVHLAGGTLTFEDGVLVAVTNRLTGETYTAPAGAGLDSGLLHDGSQADWTAAAAERSEDGARSSTTWADGAALATTVTADAAGDAVIHQEGTAPSGLHGCQWAIRGLSDEVVSLIVPAWSGVRLGNGSPVADTVLDWPTGWEAQMVIVQGRRGGFWVRADDPDDRFKGLAIRHHRGRFDLAFRTYNEGPPSQHTSIESVTWRLAFYEGDWRVPARRYREWMTQTFRTPSLAERHPPWASGIRSVVILGADRDPSQREEVRATLKELAEWVTPSKCLLYVPNWRRDTYDINYPDYTSYEGFADLVAFAHELGYRVMPHTCYYGVNLENPAYEELKPYHMRDALTGALHTYEWPWAEPVPHIAMIHPGAQAWRNLYVRKCREIVERYGADALHLDVTLAMPNVTERADGLNTVQGNVAFHRDLRGSLPEVALGGEGLNEVSCRHECFAQTHGSLAMTRPPGQPGLALDLAGADCSHPISAYLLGPHTRWYGYLGYPAPAPSDLYRGWTRAYESWGVLPTLSHPTAERLADPGPDLRVRLEEMRLIDHFDLQPDFDAEASPETKCVWTGPSGARLVCEEDGFGGSYAWFRDASGEGRTLYRYVRGRTSVRAAGHIDGWPAYDESGIYGLDPDRLHLCEPGAPEPGRPHLLRLPEDVILRSFRCTDRFLLADFALRQRVLDLTQRVSDAAIGITVRGEDKPLGNRAQLTGGYATVGDKPLQGFSVHPPWDPEPGVIGQVFAEWALPVPEGQSRLEFAIGLRDGAEQSEGVTFLVHADGREVFRQDWKRCEWQPCSVDLSDLAGRIVKLRLSVDKGPEGRGSYAWAAWGEPRLVSDAGALEFPLEVLTPREVPASLRPAGCTRVGGQGALTRYRLQATAPGPLCLLFAEPQAASLPLDLLGAEFDWSPLVGGVPLPKQNRPIYLGASQGTGRCAGVERPALAVHPPIGGETVVDYLLTLPRDPAVLTTSAGIQDGADRSNGIDFAVAVNGEVLHRQPVERADGWHPLGVDLSRWAGQTIVLSLIADARDDATCDWARWAEPVVRAK